MIKLLHNPYVKKIISEALREDCASNDITTKILIPADRVSNGYIVMKEEGIVCGIDIACACFRKLDKNVVIRKLAKDGNYVKKNSKILILKGQTRALLGGERTALNFLAHLSSISTYTKKTVKAIRPFKTQILDTRKTTPTLRILEKYAVRCGGGANHRFDLGESILIKDNHKIVLTKDSKSLSDAANIARQKSAKRIEVEVDNLAEFKNALSAGPDFILLDNMPPKKIKAAIQLLKKSKFKSKTKLEASGGITLDNIRAFAATGVNRISLGALTHGHRSINLSMELTN